MVLQRQVSICEEPGVQRWVDRGLNILKRDRGIFLDVPRVAGMVVSGVELFELLPGQVRDGQRFSTRHHGVGVIREQLVLEVLGEQTLVIRLKRQNTSTENLTTGNILI